MTESQEQKQLVAWFRAVYPEHAMSLRVSQSGGYRGKGRAGAIRSNNVAAMGGVTGEADIVLLVPRGTYPYMVIEHKAADNKAHKVSEAQQAYLDYHEANGAVAVSTRGVEAAKAAIQAYMDE